MYLSNLYKAINCKFVIFFNFILYELHCLIVCIDGPIIVALYKRYHRDQRMNDPT